LWLEVSHFGIFAFFDIKMKKLLLFVAAIAVLKLSAQMSPIGFTGLQIPNYMGSSQSGSTRLPVFIRARIMGLAPNTAYKYMVQGITANDFGSTSLFPGAGEPMFVDSGVWKTTANPSFATGADHDTLRSNFAGEYEGWVGFIYTANSRFSPGNNVYAYMSLVGVSNTDTFRLYCQDSIHVLGFGTSNNADQGTAMWGHSVGKTKNFAALFDNTFGSGRPLAISVIENDAVSIGSSAAAFYKNNVEGVTGNWGVIIPNVLNNGVQSIHQLDRYTGMAVYNNYDGDGKWGPSSKNTINPTGGLSSPISLDENDAPLVAPDIQFWARTSTVNENAGKKVIYINRKYSNAQTQSVRLTVVGGTAINGGSDDYTLTVPTTYTFNPGAAATDSAVITLNDDNVAEGDETIVLRLDQPSNCVIGTEVAHTITIKDNDIAYINSPNIKVVASEPDGSVNVKIKMDKPVNTASSLRLLVKKQGDSSYIPGEFKLGSSGKDSIFSLGKLTGPDSILIPLKIIDDVNKDPHDTFILALRQISGSAQIIDSIYTVVVLDNDGPAKVKFMNSSITVNETTTSVDVKVLVTYKTDAGGDFTLRLLTSASTATEGKDFDFNPTSKIQSIDKNTPDTIVFNVPLKDDDMFEPREKIVFNLGVLSNVIIQKPDTCIILINNDDYPIYQMSTATKQSNASKTMDSNGVKCRVTGIVHGGNLSTTGLRFGLLDNTGGIMVVGTKTFGYTVKEGDSLMVQGVIGQQNGLGIFQSLDTVILLAINKSPYTPTVVNDVTEATENKMSRFSRVKLVDASKWPSAALGANTTASIGVLHTDGTTDTLFIDAETNIDGTAAPSGYFNVNGLGGQSDASSPFTTGYYLMPRRLSDFEIATLPVVKFVKKSDTITELADSFRIDFSVAPLDENFTFDVLVKGGTALSPGDYDFSKRTISVIKNNSVNAIKANISDDNISDGTRTVLFAIRNIVGPGSIGADSVLTLVIKDNEPDNVKSFAQGNIRMFPNPAKEMVYVQSRTEMLAVEIYGLDGKGVYSSTERNNSYQIETAGFAKGIYSIRLTGMDGIRYSETLVVQ